MTAIVTGATGFIGRHLVDALAARGGGVSCLTRGKPTLDSRANVSYHHVDYSPAHLGLSGDELAGATTVYHLGGATRAVSATDFREANVSSTERLADRLIGI